MTDEQFEELKTILEIILDEIRIIKQEVTEAEEVIPALF